ncbi:TNFAIP3-interacting protein 1-like isoform X2 [Ambystoma mexicanum]|uniref:TNFAIP3-interacting protein 1-like isoform X2 n=1 Tax=Ambystoma mexicanum TaxID=8296 RepID=UPI0037E9A21C
MYVFDVPLFGPLTVSTQIFARGRFAVFPRLVRSERSALLPPKETMASETYLPFQNPPKPEYFTAQERIACDLGLERRTQTDFLSDACTAVHTDPALCDRLDSEENVTVISESMTVTSSDEEKLLLLNKNTELRRINKELMKLNLDWDQIYRSSTTGLQQTVGCLQQEVVALKQHVERLSMKLDHEQNKREYYEQTLHQELKKNQHLQEYIRHVESKLHQNSNSERRIPDSSEILRRPSDLEEIIDTQLPPHRIPYSEHAGDILETAAQKARSGDSPRPKNAKLLTQHSKARLADSKGTGKEVTELKEQLQAMKCQTEMYEADYHTEHKDRQRIKAENEKLRKKEEDMRQQMLLLQEQLKVYEDDFRKERSDKQVLQRLLKSKSSHKDPVLVHRCNNGSHEIPAAALSSPSAPMNRLSGSGKPCERHSHRHHHLRDAERPSSSFPIEFK